MPPHHAREEGGKRPSSTMKRAQREKVEPVACRNLERGVSNEWRMVEEDLNYAQAAGMEAVMSKDWSWMSSSSKSPVKACGCLFARKQASMLINARGIEQSAHPLPKRGFKGNLRMRPAKVLTLESIV